MVITKVSYGKTYSLGNYCSERIDLEASVTDGEHIEDVVKQLKDMCDTYHKTNNPHLYQEQGQYYNTPQLIKNETGIERVYSHTGDTFIQETYPSENTLIPQTQEQKFLQLISLATSTKELSMYEKTANNPKYSNLKAAYDQKYSQLTEK
jgi:predicted RNase H-like HicB family nuclease